MSLLSTLTSDDSIQDEQDRISGGLLESGVYDTKISVAYLNESEGGAVALNVHFDINGRELRQRFWISSGKKKGQKTYYETKTGERRNLPGFNTANSLCLLTVGKKLFDVTQENKVIKIWNNDAKKEVPTEVPVLTELLKQEVTIGVIKQTVDRVTKNDKGVYEPTGETREENEVDKLFRNRDKLTTAEIIAQAEKAEFYDKWKEKWTGKNRDNSTRRSNSNTSQTSNTFNSATNSAQKPTESLFK